MASILGRYRSYWELEARCYLGKPGRTLYEAESRQYKKPPGFEHSMCLLRTAPVWKIFAVDTKQDDRIRLSPFALWRVLKITHPEPSIRPENT